MVDQSIFYQPDQRMLQDALLVKLESRKPTKAEALADLQGAGILDENGEFTLPYSNLGRYIKSLNKEAG
jgi:hypothetical protein